MYRVEASSLIHDERNRQINEEGWTEQHDDAHSEGELALAATAYYLNATGRCALRSDGVPLGWPWDAKWWKPKSAERDLVRAGALFLAEQERLFRMPGGFGEKHSRANQITPKLDRVIKALMTHPSERPPTTAAYPDLNDAAHAEPPHPSTERQDG